MFQPNNIGMLSALNGTNAYGEAQFGKPQRVRCAVVTLEGEMMKTPVRADSSASRGAADETVGKGMILFPKNVTPSIGSLFVIAGRRLRIIGSQPRYGVIGTLDHWECLVEAFPK